MDIGMLETRPEAALREVGAMLQTFGIITISDGICMGTEGRKT
jgi:dihydroxy-acid dehydratase